MGVRERVNGEVPRGSVIPLREFLRHRLTELFRDATAHEQVLARGERLNELMARAEGRLAGALTREEQAEMVALLRESCGNIRALLGRGDADLGVSDVTPSYLRQLERELTEQLAGKPLSKRAALSLVSSAELS